MPAPLTFLGPAIDLIARNANVLPAVGGAFEDLARPDVEEADDRFFGSEAGLWRSVSWREREYARDCML
jgi:hypothetical protein